MTDHAAPIRALLTQIASDADLPRAMRAIAADAEGAVEVEAVLSRTGRALVHLEAHVTYAENKAKALREALLNLIVETGAPAFSIGTHTISTSETRRVHITDQAAIPAALMRQPPPEPDTKAIRSLLASGADVPGAVLSNASPTLTIRSRQK
jgi:uncharacterized protein (UPF0147 family)